MRKRGARNEKIELIKAFRKKFIIIQFGNSLFIFDLYTESIKVVGG